MVPSAGEVALLVDPRREANLGKRSSAVMSWCNALLHQKVEVGIEVGRQPSARKQGRVKKYEETESRRS
jgi:hypothetical protein